MGLPRALLWPMNAPVYGVVPMIRASPLGQVALPTTFGGRTKFHKGTLDFQVMDLLSAYRAIVGRPCYAKFMAVPNYAYLKLKLPSPRGIIIVSGDLHRAHSCEEENLNITVAVSQASEL